jgi:hypothetical protein
MNHCPAESIAWDAPETIQACRMLFRQRAEDESPEDFLRAFSRSSPHDYLTARRLAWLYGLQLAPLFRRIYVLDRSRERRSWAVWERKRRARKGKK